MPGKKATTASTKKKKKTSRKATPRGKAGKAATALLEALERVSFFEGYPAEAAERARGQVRSAEVPADAPGLALMSVWMDWECIYDEGDYEKLLSEFAAGSFGVLAPEKVTERWKGESIELSFVQGGRTYRQRIPFEGGDYVDPAFFELLATFFRRKRPRLEFQTPDGEGFVLATRAAYDRAVEAGLLPRRQGDGVAAEQPVQKTRVPLPATAAEYLAVLEVNDAFARLPVAYGEQARQGVAAAYRDGRHPASGLAIVTTKRATHPARVVPWLESVIREVRDRSHGLLVGEDVRVDVRPDNRNDLRLRMTVAGRAIEGWMELDGPTGFGFTFPYPMMLLTEFFGRALQANGIAHASVGYFTDERRDLHFYLRAREATWANVPDGFVPDDMLDPVPKVSGRRG